MGLSKKKKKMVIGKPQSITFKADRSDFFFLPVEQAWKSSRLSNGAKDNSYLTKHVPKSIRTN